MKKLILAAALIFPLCGMHGLTTTQWYVSATGSDSNDCLSLSTPCLTIQHATDLAALFGDQINVADGYYTAGASIVGQRVDIIGNPAHPENVVVTGLTNTNIFWAQDHSIMTLNGFTVEQASGQTGVTDVVCRQDSIIDTANMRFGASSTAHLANEGCKINAGNSELFGSVTIFYNASGISQIVGNSTVTIDSGVSVSWFIAANQNSVVDVHGMSIVGTLASGSQWLLDNAVLAVAPSTVPGSAIGDITQHYYVIE